MGVATALYRLGARVIVTSRSVAKAEVACATVKKAVDETPKTGDNVGELVPMSLSLDDLDSVKSFAQEFCSRFKKLEYLCENAGIAMQDTKNPKPSKQGYEMCYASNYLGHALLMELLLPTLLASAPARVSFTSSITHWGATSDKLDALLPDGDFARGRVVNKAYFDSKLCQVLYAFELQRRYRGKGVTFTPVAPGLIATDIFVVDQAKRGAGDSDQTATKVSLMKPVTEGCLTNLHALLAPSQEGLEGFFLQPYYSPKHLDKPLLGGFIGVAVLFEFLQQKKSWGCHRWIPSPDAHNKEFAAKLFDETKAAVAQWM